MGHILPGVSFVDKVILIALKFHSSELFLEQFLLLSFFTFSLILSKRLQHFNDFHHFVVIEMTSDKKT